MSVMTEIFAKMARDKRKKEKHKMRIIKKYAIGKDDGQGDAVFFERMQETESRFIIEENRTRRIDRPKFGSLDNAKLFITEKEADDYIKENDLKDAWPVEIMVGY